jgi:ankyrin repeat protein
VEQGRCTGLLTEASSPSPACCSTSVPMSIRRTTGSDTSCISACAICSFLILTGSGNTPLHLASLRGQVAMASFLLDRGADSNLQEKLESVAPCISHDLPVSFTPFTAAATLLFTVRQQKDTQSSSNFYLNAAPEPTLKISSDVPASPRLHASHTQLSHTCTAV